MENKLKFKINDVVGIGTKDKMISPYYGTIKKIEITSSGVTYWVQFYKDEGFRSFPDRQMELVKISYPERKQKISDYEPEEDAI